VDSEALQDPGLHTAPKRPNLAAPRKAAEFM